MTGERERDEGLPESVRLAIELQLGREDVDAEARLREDLAADSFALMSLVASIEEDHGVEITETEVAHLSSVADLIALVVARKREG